MGGTGAGKTTIAYALSNPKLLKINMNKEGHFVLEAKRKIGNATIG